MSTPSTITSSETADIQPRRKKVFPLALVASVFAMVALKMGFFFFVIGMLPTLVTPLFMRRPSEYVLSTVAAFNFSGVFPDLLSITMQGGTPRAVTDHLAAPSVWASMYGAALLGWFIVWLAPGIAMLFLEVIYRGRMHHMEHLQKKLEEEWGTEIKEKAEQR